MTPASMDGTEKAMHGRAMKPGIFAYYHDVGRIVRNDVKLDIHFAFWKVTSLFLERTTNLCLLLVEKA